MVSIMSASSGARTPWHLWVVVGVGILWNAFGCIDYTMTALQGEMWLRQMGMTEAQITSYEAMPAWMTGVWAIGVWGALLGTVLLLLKNRLAVPVFVVSLIAYVGSLVYAYALSDQAEVMPEGTWIMQVVVLVGCLFFVWYSRMMGKRGVLR
jgi:4-hydroxybenzoate polyprenyltransferase